MRATGSHDLHLDVDGAGRTRCSAGVEGLALLVAQLMPHWLVASYAAVYVGVAQAAVDAAVEHLQRPQAGSGCRRCGPGSAGPRRRGRRGPAGRGGGGPPGRRGPGRRRRPTAGCGGPSCSPAPPRRRSAASMLEAAGTSATRRGHPLERLYRDARCGSLQPATSDVCADWLGVAALGRRPGRTTAGGAAMVSGGSAGDRAASPRRPRPTSRPGRAVGRLLRRALRGDVRLRRADLRELGRAHPARGGQPAGRGRRPAGAPGSGWSATWPRRCRWARRRSTGALADAGLDPGERRPVRGRAPAPATSTPGPGHPARPRPRHGRRVQRLFVGHMGCYAALPGLGAVGRLRRGPRPARRCCSALELTSLHIQPATADDSSRSSRTRCSRTRRPPSCWRPAPTRPAGLRTVRRRRRAHRHHHGRPHDLGRHRPRLPDGPVAAGAGRAGPARPRAWSTTCSAGTGWPVRRRRLGGAPGRAAILDVVAAPARSCRPARWPRRGRAGRARQLLVADRAAGAGADRAAGTVRPGRHAVAMAFGPGLTLYAALLRAT